MKKITHIEELMDVLDGPEQECYPLLDRDCILLDGSCNCERPVSQNCKYLKKEDFEDNRNIDPGHQTPRQES